VDDMLDHFPDLDISFVESGAITWQRHSARSWSMSASTSSMLPVEIRCRGRAAPA
jgi:hypothetical protein